MKDLNLETFENFIERKKLEKKKEKKFYDIGRKGHWFAKLQDMVYVSQYNSPDKYLTLEILKFTRSEGELIGSPCEIQYRFGYYMRCKVSKGNKRLNQWVWGQYCPIMPIEDFNKLMNLAKEKGWKQS